MKPLTVKVSRLKVAIHTRCSFQACDYDKAVVIGMLIFIPISMVKMPIKSAAASAIVMYQNEMPKPRGRCI